MTQLKQPMNRVFMFIVVCLISPPSGASIDIQTNNCMRSSDDYLSSETRKINSLQNDIVRGTYGVDVSWPIHHSKVSTNFAWLPHNSHPQNHEVPEEYKDMPVQPMEDRAKVYEEFMRGCREHYKEEEFICERGEEERIAKAKSQPSKMTNYTELGFKKVRVPEDLFEQIQTFYENNKGNAKVEHWQPRGNTHMNYWNQASTTVALDGAFMVGGGPELLNAILNMAKPVVSEFVSREVRPISIYGVRVYHEGSILAPHVDRLPMVSSAIINVAQDVDEIWPLEVYGHDGNAYNVTLEPGDMVLYESHSILHGRPFPLQGRYYANIFVQFEPVPVHANTAQLARQGDLAALKQVAALDRHQLYSLDQRRWQPLQEAVVAGRRDVVRFLVKDQGADVNHVTIGEKTATDLCIENQGSEGASDMVSLLRELGGATYSELQNEEVEHGSKNGKLHEL